MSQTVLLITLIVLAFVGGQFLTRVAARLGMVAGAESLLLGVIVGPLGLGLLSGASLDRAQLLVALLLGLVGFSAGARARRLAEAPEAVVVGGAAALGVAAGIAGLALAWMYHFQDAVGPWLLHLRAPLGWGFEAEIRVTSLQLEAALVLGAAGAACSSTVVDATVRRLGAKGPVTTLLTSAAAATEIVAIVILGLVLAGRRELESGARLPLGITEWALLGMGVGVVCGLLFAWFARGEDDPKRLFVAATGVVIFAAGVGLAIGLSPTFVNLLAGLTVALVSPQAQRIHEELDRLRHAIHVLILAFAGMLLALPSGWGWLLAVAYPLLRGGLYRLLIPVCARMLLETPPRGQRMGAGLLGQGTLPVVIAVAYVMREPSHAGLVLATVLVATISSDLWSVRMLSSVLLDAGEVADTSGAAVVEAAGGVSAVHRAAVTERPLVPVTEGGGGS